MTARSTLLSMVFFASTSVLTAQAPPLPQLGPDADPRDARAYYNHGIERVDDYAWLRASNWQTVMRDPSVLDPEIRNHLEAENTYTSSVMADTEALQERLFAEMKGRIKEDDESVPAPDGAFTSINARF